MPLLPLPSTQRATQNLTETGDIFGSPLYMSPEQCVGNELDARSDIYALGCVMYEALCGKSPFAAENNIKTIVKHINEQPLPLAVAGRNLNISTDLQALVMRCLQKDVRLRYQSMEELRQDLEAIRDGKPIKSSNNLSVQQRDGRKIRRQLVMITICLGIVAVAINLLGNRLVHAPEYQPVETTAAHAIGTDRTRLQSAQRQEQVKSLKNDSGLPDDLFNQLNGVNNDRQRISIILQWKKANPGFNYYVENMLRHLYSGIDERKSAEQMDLIMKHQLCDEYTTNIASGWELGKHDEKAVVNLLKWPREYPDLKYLDAACWSAVAEHYAKIGNPEEAKAYYRKILSSKVSDSDYQAYRDLADIALSKMH